MQARGKTSQPSQLSLKSCGSFPFAVIYYAAICDHGQIWRLTNMAAYKYGGIQIWRLTSSHLFSKFINLLSRECNIKHVSSYCNNELS